MVSIAQILKDRSLWFVTIAISALFILVPKILFDYSYPLSFAFTLLILLFVIADIPGFSCVIFAYNQMLPLGDFHMKHGAAGFYISYYCTLLSIVLFLTYKRKSINYNFSFLNKLVVLFICLSVIFEIKTGLSDEIRDIFYYITSTVGFFYLCLNDRITLKQFYSILDVVFYFTLFYVIQENVLDASPFKSLYALLPGDLATRAKGLMGHPLILSSFLSFYNAALLSKILIYKRWDILNILLMAPLIVLAASRTVILLVIVSWVLFFLLSGYYKKIFTYVVAVGIIIGSIFLFPSIEKKISSQVDRLKNAKVTQREGSYDVAMQVFDNNMLGIGYSRAALHSELTRGGVYHLNSKYDFNFLIFDNAYLTAICSYGVLGFVLFIVYFHPVIILYRTTKNQNQKKLFYSGIIILVVLMLQNISFDSYFYFPVNSFYFLVLSVFLKERDVITGQNAVLNFVQSKLHNNTDNTNLITG